MPFSRVFLRCCECGPPDLPPGLRRRAFAVSPLGASPLAEALRPFVDRRTLAGAVALVANGERVLSVEAVGFSDLAARRPMQTEDVFWIASMSKPITAAAVMLLVDEGRLNLDDPIERYLPEFKHLMVVAEKDAAHLLLRRPAQRVSVRHLLSHTSGMSFRSGIEEPALDLHPLATRVRSYAMMPLEFEPGSKYQYSNAGINTAGRIVEVITQTPFEVFLERRLFQPLGMIDTTFRPTAAQLARLAMSYKGSADKSILQETPIHQLTYPLDGAQREPMPAGGLFSTAADVARFGQLMLNQGVHGGRRLLSEFAVREMSRRQTAESLKNSYGLGFQTNGVDFSHAGAYSTNLSIKPERGVVTVFMVQNAGWRTEDGKRVHPEFQRAALQLVRK